MSCYKQASILTKHRVRIRIWKVECEGSKECKYLPIIGSEEARDANKEKSYIMLTSILTFYSLPFPRNHEQQHLMWTAAAVCM
jgi:hypothetical protein